MIHYQNTNQSVVVFVDGKPTTIPQHSLKSQQIVNAINAKASETMIKEILEKDETAILSDITGGVVQFIDGKLVSDDLIIPDSVSRRVDHLIEAGITDVSPWVNFLNKLIDNPSRASVVELYDWLEYQGLPLCEDGDVLGYKGVSENYYSISAGSTKLVSGETDESGHILNSVGSIIEMRRNEVDDNRDNGCSYGLHIGNYNYAKSFGSHGRMLVVKFNPADAVSVPHCSDYQKLRVAKYQVVKDITERKTFLDKPLYSIENGDLHAHTIESEREILEELENAWDTSYLLEISKDYGVNPDQLVRVLHRNGYTVNWDNPQNPSIVSDYKNEDDELTARQEGTDWN